MKLASKDFHEELKRAIDRRRGGIYDRVKLAAGRPTPKHIACFQNQIGSFATWDRTHTHLCTLADTNMLSANQLPAPYDLIAQRFIFLFEEGAPDAAEFVRNYGWEFRMLYNRVVFRETMLRCSARVDHGIDSVLEGYGEPAPAPGFPHVSLRSMAHPFTFHLGDFCKYIPPLSHFQLDLIGEPFTPAHDLNFFVVIDGVTDGPYQ